jgi:predicted nucleic acid-binding Zn ribbon protein
MMTFPELPMESVRSGLRQIMQDLLRTRPAEEAVILAWPLVCGKEVAARTTAASLSDGTLTVEVSDVSWRNQLQSFSPRYLSGYEGLLGQVVKSVVFKVKGSAAKTQQ